MKFHWWDAAILFVLWLAQFVEAGWRDEITLVYLGWAVLLIVSWFWRASDGAADLLAAGAGEAARRRSGVKSARASIHTKNASPAAWARLAKKRNEEDF